MAIQSDIIEVLFIDDDIELLDAVKRLIKVNKVDWKVRYSASPIDAFRILKEHGATINVVVCDINMPYISGVKMLKFISVEFPHIARLALSGMLDVNSLLGSDRYSDTHICKPVEFKYLHGKIIEAHKQKNKL